MQSVLLRTNLAQQLDIAPALFAGHLWVPTVFDRRNKVCNLTGVGIDFGKCNLTAVSINPAPSSSANSFGTVGITCGATDFTASSIAETKSAISPA